MRALGASCILTLATFSCCGVQDPATPASSQQEGDGIADAKALHGDFIAALKGRHWSEPDGFETCVLEPETTLWPEDREDKDPERWEEFQWRLPALQRDTYDSFWSENERPRPIAPLDPGAMELRFLTRAEAAEILSNDAPHEYWERFRSRYGNAVLVRLSAPGFSADRQQALIYFEAQFGWLAAWGSYALLTREGDRWEIAEVYAVWEA